MSGDEVTGTGLMDTLEAIRKNKFNNGLKKVLLYGILIVVLSSTTLSLLGNFFRKDFSLEQSQEQIQKISSEIEALKQEIQGIKIEQVALKTELNQRLINVEENLRHTNSKIETSIESIRRVEGYLNRMENNRRKY